MAIEDQQILRDQLTKLTDEHRELDQLIEEMRNEKIVNQIGIQRFKKRKLLLKDQMIKVQSRLLPDIIA